MIKKIYTFAVALILFGSLSAQSFSGTYEPVGDVMNSYGAQSTQGLGITPLYQDSTVQFGYYSTLSQYISTIMLGSVLDPTSPNLDPLNYLPICSAVDSFYVDTISIIGQYKKVTQSIDTLYTWIVWGPPPTTTTTLHPEFQLRPPSQVSVIPGINTWKDFVLDTKVAGATGAAGNKVKPIAPATNMVLIKRILTNADTAADAYIINIGVASSFPNGIKIPAGNVVSCFYTFVPGGVYSPGDISFVSDYSTLTQTVNGFGGVYWTQAGVSSASDYEPYQVDPDGWNMGLSYDKYQRHKTYNSFPSMSYMDNEVIGNLTMAPLIYYSIHGTKTNVAPATPGSISGPTNLCAGSNCNYSVTPVTGATSYDWVLPNGWSGSSTTNTISATASSFGGNITVTASNAAGTSAAKSLSISIDNSSPATPGSISGPTNICAGANSTYSVVSVAGATFYDWTFPGGLFETSTTNSITTNSINTPGSITVTAGNACGISSAASMTVNVTGFPNAGITSSGSTINAIATGVTYQWVACPSYTDAPGISTNRSYTAAAGGEYAVIVSNGVCPDTSVCVNITFVGIDEIENKNPLIIYPNPSDKAITIQSPNEGVYSIVNQLGQIAQSIKLNVTNNNTVTIENLNSGVYYITGTNNNVLTKQKIIVTK